MIRTFTAAALASLALAGCYYPYGYYPTGYYAAAPVQTEQPYVYGGYPVYPAYPAYYPAPAYAPAWGWWGPSVSLNFGYRGGYRRGYWHH
jgi:hypothetical protein